MGGVIPKISAHENCRYIARLYGLDPDYVESFCRWLCNLGEYFDQPIGTYSSGMRARFSFALMLALDFDIYLIDEGMPSSTDVEFNRKGGRSAARALAYHNNCYRVASGPDARKIRALGGGPFGWQATHVRHAGRGKTAL